MADTLSAVERSRLMSRVPNKDTKPELLIRRYLHGQGFRFRLHGKNLPGKPDIILPKYKTVVFVHGCFWHQHGANCAKVSGIPSSNTAFWQSKLARNSQRDSFVQTALADLGWTVLVVWECELKRKTRDAALSRLTSDILGESDIWAAA